MPTNYFVPKSTTDLTSLFASPTLDDDSTVTFAEGSQAITGGLSQPTINLKQMYVGPQFTGNVGGAGSSFEIQVGGGGATGSPRFVYAAGGGAFYLGTSSGTYTRIQAIGRGSLYMTNGTITDLETRSGLVNVNGSTVVTNAYVQGGEANFLNNATAITDAVVSGGVGNFQRNLTTLKVAGQGVANIYRDDTSATMPTATTIELGSGTLKWRGGNITTLRAWGSAMIDLSAAPIPFTITNLIIDHQVWERSNLRPASRYAALTVTNTTIYASERDTV